MLESHSLRAPRQVSRWLRAALGRRSVRNNPIRDIFVLVPRSRFVIARFAYVVADLPTPDGPLFIDTYLDRSVDALSELGLYPITLRAHLEGLAVIVRELVDSVPDLASARSTVGVSTWTFFDGPYGAFRASHPGPHAVSFGACCASGVDQLARSRSFLLSQILSRPDLICLSPRWSEILHAV